MNSTKKYIWLKLHEQKVIFFLLQTSCIWFFIFTFYYIFPFLTSTFVLFYHSCRILFKTFIKLIFNCYICSDNFLAIYQFLISDLNRCGVRGVMELLNIIQCSLYKENETETTENIINSLESKIRLTVCGLD